MTKHYVGWRKSRHSDPNGACIEVARVTGGTIGVRDSKGDLNVVLEFSPREWSAFFSSLKEAKV